MTTLDRCVEAGMLLSMLGETCIRTVYIVSSFLVMYWVIMAANVSVKVSILFLVCILLFLLLLLGKFLLVL